MLMYFPLCQQHNTDSSGCAKLNSLYYLFRTFLVIHVINQFWCFIFCQQTVYAKITHLIGNNHLHKGMSIKILLLDLYFLSVFAPFLAKQICRVLNTNLNTFPIIISCWLAVNKLVIDFVLKSNLWESFLFFLSGFQWYYIQYLDLVTTVALGHPTC